MLVSACLSLYQFVHPCVCSVSVCQQTVILCHSFAVIILKLSLIIDRLIRLCKKQFSTIYFLWFNSLPNDNILDLSKLKAYADDKITVTEKLKFVFGRVENIVGKGENAGYQHFLLFPHCFLKASCTGSLKVGIVW